MPVPGGSHARHPDRRHQRDASAPTPLTTGTAAAATRDAAPPSNAALARCLDEVGDLLEAQQADAFRVRAYHVAAAALRQLASPVTELYRTGGLAGLEQLPGVGRGIARALRDLIEHGRLPLLERLHAEDDPVQLFGTLPGIGEGLADRLHHDHGYETLEQLMAALDDGRLARIPGFGPRRLTTLRAAILRRLARPRLPPPAPRPPPLPVGELLDVDREYRDAASSGRLPLITPRRHNPEKRAWLPVLHTARGTHHYTALFSNTERAHRLGRTHDWVVIYADGEQGESQATVVTEQQGPLAGRRVVRGREGESAGWYATAPSGLG